MSFFIMSGGWSVASALSASWSIYENVQEALPVSWTIYEGVLSSLGCSWEIGNTVLTALPVSWKAYGPINTSVSVSWAVRNYFGTGRPQFKFIIEKRVKEFFLDDKTVKNNLKKSI